MILCLKKFDNKKKIILLLITCYTCSDVIQISRKFVYVYINCSYAYMREQRICVSIGDSYLHITKTRITFVSHAHVNYEDITII